MVSVDKDLNESFQKLATPIYKIGDLGHVSRARSTSDPITDTGDARFISIERFQESWTDLTKSDIFSFGLTVYQLMVLGVLPKNGKRWFKLRDNFKVEVNRADNAEFEQLTSRMLSKLESERPAACEIKKFLQEDECREKLLSLLEAERSKNEQLEHEINRLNASLNTSNN